MSFEAERFSGIEFRSQVRAEGDTRFESSPIWKSAHITYHRVVAITTRRGLRKEERKGGGKALCAVAGIQFCREMGAPYGASGKKEIKGADSFSLPLLDQSYIL